MLVAALVSPGGSAHTPITDMPSIIRTYLNPGERNTSMMDWLVECHFSTHVLHIRIEVSRWKDARLAKAYYVFSSAETT